MRKLWTSALAIGAAMGWSGAAVAQDNAEGAELTAEIVVTVQKREQAIQDVPINITAYSGDALEKLGVTKFDELALFVPGLEIQEQSPNNPGFVIRGVTSDDGAAFQEQRVAVYQDGVSISRARGAYVALFDNERIEVAKGPQATLFGRGALIGAINIIRRKAEVNQMSGYAAGAFGDYEQRRLEGAVNLPVVEGVLGVRAAAIENDRAGVVSNILGGKLSGNGVSAQRLSARFAPGDAFSLDLVYDRQVDEWEGTAFKSGTIAPVGGNTSPFTFAALNLSAPGFEGGKEIGIERDLSSFTATADWELSDALTISAQAAYREFDSLEVFDPDGSQLPILLVAEQATGEQTSFEGRVRFDNGGPFSAFFGASYFSEEATQRVPLRMNQAGVALLSTGVIQTFAATNPSIPSIAAVIATLPAAQQPTFTALNGVFVREEFENAGGTDSVDVFADATLAIGEKLELTGGVRYTRDEKTASVIGRQTVAPVGTAFLLVPPTARRSQSAEFDGLTWRVVAKYAVDDNINVFLSQARGRRPDVINAQVGNAASNTPFAIIPAEEVDSTELGLKASAMDGRLNFDGSVFRYEYSNFQTTERTPAGQIITVNAGEADAIGAELGVGLQAYDWLNFNATYAHNGARLRSGVRSGNKFRLSPDHSLSLVADATVPVMDGVDVFFRPSFTYQSEVFFDDDNDKLDARQEERQAGYGLLNLRGGVTFADRYTATLFVTNALDEEYLIDAGNTGDLFGIPTFIRGAPRLVGLEVRGSF